MIFLWLIWQGFVARLGNKDFHKNETKKCMGCLRLSSCWLISNTLTIGILKNLTCWALSDFPAPNTSSRFLSTKFSMSTTQKTQRTGPSCPFSEFSCFVIRPFERKVPDTISWFSKNTAEFLLPSCFRLFSPETEFVFDICLLKTLFSIAFRRKPQRMFFTWIFFLVVLH